MCKSKEMLFCILDDLQAGLVISDNTGTGTTYFIFWHHEGLAQVGAHYSIHHVADNPGAKFIE